MAKYKFSQAQRVALWEAHNRRCFYSGNPLAYSDLHIDHILPESLLDKPSELERINREYGLDPDFEINSYYNWVPAHSRYNLKKSDIVLNENQTLILLAIAKQKYPKVVRQERKYNQGVKKDKVLVSLALLHEKGDLSLEEAFAFLKGLEKDEAEIKLLHKLEFAERTIVDYVGRSDAEELLNLTVVHATPHHKGLQLTDGTGDKITVRTCKEYKAAKAKGYFSLTTYDMKIESLFNRTCGIVNALARAMPANRSYIEAPRVGIVDLNLMPVTVLSAMSCDTIDVINEAYAKGITVQDWIDEGKVQVKAVSRYAIHLKHSMGQIIWELMRSDFTGDGVEDILTYSYSYAIGGSFGYGDIMTLTRLGPDENLSIIK